MRKPAKTIDNLSSSAPPTPESAIRNARGEPVDVSLALDWMQNITSAMSRNEEHLTRLDSAIGDGDHGADIAPGFTAVRERLDDPSTTPASVGEVLTTAGNSLVSVVGGASGPLFGGASGPSANPSARPRRSTPRSSPRRSPRRWQRCSSWVRPSPATRP